MIEAETVGKRSSSTDVQVSMSLIVLACALLVFKFFWNKRDLFRKASAIPSSNLTGIFSFTGDLVGKSVEGCSQQLFRYFEASPEVFKGWLGHFLMVGVSKPEHIEIIMTNPSSLGKSHLIEFIKDYMGEGLFTAPAHLWRKQRKLINPSFNQKVLNSFIPIFQEKCDILLGVLENHVGQPDIDILQLISRCTVESVCEAAMGLRIDSQNSDNRYGELLDRALDIAMTRIWNVMYHPAIIFYTSALGKECTKIVGELNSFTQKVIKEKRALFDQKKKDEYSGDEDNGGMKSTLDLLLELSKNDDFFSDKQLQDEVNTIIAGGSDTTAAALSFCFLTMGLFPEYQEKLYEEAIEVLGVDRYSTKEDLPKLKFTEMFIKETLRIFPVAPLLLRVASNDIKLDEVVLPKDSVILMSIINLHRSPKNWENPLKFDPNRFLPEEWAKKHTFSYLPFAGGPRNCIGHKYAMILMKLVLSKIVRKFKIKTTYKSIEEVEIKMKLLLRPSNGFKVQLELRE